MQTTENKVEKFIKQKNLMPADGKILLAVSGGADSVALLLIFNRLFHDRLHVAHINHQLRGSDSLNDEYYVQQLASMHKIPFTAELVDVNAFARRQKLSIETAARQLRLEALIKIADRYGCRAIATAHHSDDNAETIIQRMLRGTGYKGLAGIRTKTLISGRTFIRPLLCLSRDEIEKYLNSQSIPWQTDSTNADTRFTRNRIRHKLLPALKEETPKIVQILSDLADRCERLSSKIEQLCDSAARECFISQDERCIVIDSAKFVHLPKPVRVELLQKALTQIKCGLQSYTSEHYKKMDEFVNSAQTGKTLALPGKVSIAKGYNKFFIGTSKIKADIVESITLKLPGETVFGNYIIKTELIDRSNVSDIQKKGKNIEFFDFSQIKPPLTVRQRQKGDKFCPFGQKKLKKVGKFLTSEKIDSALKNQTIVICDNASILWVAPVRRSSGAVIAPKTPQILKITVLPVN